MMKKYIVEHFQTIFNEKLPNDYYLADFVLSHIIGHPNFYHNYNNPEYFSINGKGGFMISFIDFVDSVVNTHEPKKYNEDYIIIVTDLVRRGAPSILFKKIYQSCCPE